MSKSEAINKEDKEQSWFTSLFAIIVIPLTVVVAHLVFHLVFGHDSHFQEGDNANEPLPGNYMGIIYKGGVIVPFLMAMLMMTIIFSIERSITLAAAKGKGRITRFVRTIKSYLQQDRIDEAVAECDRQQGSVGNVIQATLLKYKELMNGEPSLNKEQKIVALNKELHEATSLELPALERNLPVLATLGSVATLVALLGTVLGMIKAFAAMSEAGAPDAAALATGISEALINTAIGIGTAALAIICYNYFTNKIDSMTYSIDEAGMSIAHTFSAKYTPIAPGAALQTPNGNGNGGKKEKENVLEHA